MKSQDNGRLPPHYVKYLLGWEPNSRRVASFAKGEDFEGFHGLFLGWRLTFLQTGSPLPSPKITGLFPGSHREDR
ncbi:PREDICTED: putative transcript Y 13 protein [Cercocebus atys]|uniref:putative transcript Y 13 protein n=1 Tax=Cercocebus atys TaxID=9531 RepID=UPI0005F40D84|nr:PREDICTED: putative transcript Y 13 protein [Cercocebus atys]